MYKDIWTAPIGEDLACKKPEFSNLHDPYAVAVVTTNDVTVGHLPRCISTVSHLFLRKNGSIICQVTGEYKWICEICINFGPRKFLTIHYYILILIFTALCERDNDVMFGVIGYACTI